ncbi:ABC transporter permease [Rhodoplanes sp. Z2-YC6860]|uniref:ABC transporter permease n=1 Tax=Rhodoplanes sp. Z2-YC6860 TaxID=674703 RepID=UPI00078ED87B|nr:ABC transporter permease [Rhodoplanes sp. Z2-YC6860]AMN44038.1 oligopeptide ABC transporter permease [Rhodoplanes sp. Z2-YC6860]
MRRRLSASTILALALLLGVAVLVAVVPMLPGYDPFAQDLASGLLPPGGESFDGRVYLLGTDTLGRDVLSRLALAGRISLFIGFSAVLLSLVIGVFLGLLAGFFRGWIENVVMGVADLQLSIPRVLLLIAIGAIIGTGVVNLAVLLGITSWVVYGRVARAMALSLREREFVLSATTQGATAAWNIRKHLLPNVLPQMLIVGSYELGQIIVLEASLSYLGLGVQPPMPSWGLMVSEGQTYLELDPWLSVLPSIALFMLVAGVQILSQSFTAENDMSAEIVKA